VTLATNTSYAINNSSITNPYYSYDANPAGYPTWFSFTDNSTWNGTPPTTPTTVAQFSAVGNICFFRYYQTNTGAGSSSSNLTISQPIPSTISASIYHDIVTAYVSTNDDTVAGALVTVYGILYSNTLIYNFFSSGAYKAAWIQGFYAF
jgi:hypothetical protein